MSSVLPIKEGDFAKKDYWDKFFKHRGNQAFEWYGDYTSNIELYMKYVKASDDILVVGCGNSDLSQHLYDLQKCQKIWNIDVSAVVIRQMKGKCCKNGSRPGLHYEVADVCNMDSLLSAAPTVDSIWPLSFSVVIDKGTMDAMHSDKDSLLPEKMLDQICAVLSRGGRYICISLAQEHIVDTLLDFFIHKCPGWIIRCHRLSIVQDDQSQFPLPIFAFVFTKLFAEKTPTENSKKMPCVIEVCAHSSASSSITFSRLQGPLQMKNWIRTQQNATMSLHSMRSSGETSFVLAHSSVDQSLFFCYLMEAPPLSGKGKKSKVPMMNPYAVFIVPFGQEDSFTFVSPENRKSLVQQTKCRRLLIVYVNPRWRFEGAKQGIESLLNETALSYAPQNLPSNFRINYLSTPEVYDWMSTQTISIEQCSFILEKSPTVGKRLAFVSQANEVMTFFNDNLKGNQEQLSCALLNAMYQSLQVQECGSVLFCALPPSMQYITGLKAVDYFFPQDSAVGILLLNHSQKLFSYFPQHPTALHRTDRELTPPKTYSLIYASTRDDRVFGVSLSDLSWLCANLHSDGFIFLLHNAQELEVREHLQNTHCTVVAHWSFPQPDHRQWYEADVQYLTLIGSAPSASSLWENVHKELKENANVDWCIVERIMQALAM